MRSPVFNTITLLIAAGGLAAGGTALAATRTAAAGGGGGGPFVASCGSGWSLRGFDARVGSWIDAVKPICIGSSTNALESAVDEKVVNPAFGGTGGEPKRLWCYKNAAVRAIIVQSGKVTDKTRAVTSIRLVCGTRDGLGAPTPSVYGDYFAPQKPDNRTERLTCPSGQVATGIYGRSGKWLDQIGLVCGYSGTR